MFKTLFAEETEETRRLLGETVRVGQGAWANALAVIPGLRSFLAPALLKGNAALDIGMPQALPTATTVAEDRWRASS